MAKRKAKEKKYRFNEHDENQVQVTLKKTKKKKRRKKTKRFLVVIAIIVIIAYVVSPASRVKSIKVEGNNVVKSEDVIKQSKLTSNKSFFLYTIVSTKSLKNRINQLAMVDKASIKYDFVGNVKIKVKESTMIAWGKIGKHTYAIDRNGRVCEISDNTDLTGLTQVSDFKKLKLFKEFAQEYVKIPNIIRNDISDIVYSPKRLDTKRISFRMNDGKIFYLRIDDMAEQLENFDYDAYMQAYSDRCIFSFEGENLFMKKCYTPSSDQETESTTDSTNTTTDTTSTPAN